MLFTTSEYVHVWLWRSRTEWSWAILLTHTKQILVGRLGSPSGFRTGAILWVMHDQRVGFDPRVCHCGIGHHSRSTKQAYRTHGPYGTRHARPLLGVKRTRNHPAIGACWNKVPRREHC